MASKTESMVIGLEDVIGRKLDDEERSGIEVWAKSFDLAHFTEGFPQEWQLFKDMLKSYLKDFKDQWDELSETSPKDAGNLAVLQAQLFGANYVINSFIRDVENAQEMIRQVPDIVRENAGQLRSVPG